MTPNDAPGESCVAVGVDSGSSVQASALSHLLGSPVDIPKRLASGLSGVRSYNQCENTEMNPRICEPLACA
jgi:hypothetical protein